MDGKETCFYPILGTGRCANGRGEMDVEWLREWGGLIGKYSAVKGKGMDRFINIFRGICVFVFGKG